jgi:hypothetical protein
MRAWNHTRDSGIDLVEFSDWSGTLCIVTEALPPPPPSTPATFHAQRGVGPRIILTWSDTSNETEYILRAFNHLSHAFAFQQTVAADTTTYVDDVGGTQRGGVDYELSACNVSGCSAPVRTSVVG